MDEDKKSSWETFTEEIEVAGAQLMDEINRLLAEGNVRRLQIRSEKGDVYLSVPLTAGAVAGGVVALVGALTALFAATIALTQFDLKRVLAYSTISQLGLMFLAVGVGAYTAAIFHLTTHAFFKGLLFLGAGSVMHAMGNRIDIREMGGLRRYLPATHWTFLAGTLAISGFPLLAGWWSKDEILAEAFHLGTRVWWAPGWLLWALGSLASLLTAFYMVRAYTLAFHSDPRIDPEVEAHLHESPRSMTVPLWVLAGLSIVGGAALALPGSATTAAEENKNA